MSPIVVSRILVVLLIINEVFVVATSKTGEIQSLKVPLITRVAAILFVIPFFYVLDWPAWLGWLIVAMQAGGFALELLAELQLMRAGSFAVSSGGATRVQQSGMYRFLENPVYLGILAQLLAWALWMPLVLIPVFLFGRFIRSMVEGEREYLAEKHQVTHRGIDSFLWN